MDKASHVVKVTGCPSNESMFCRKIKLGAVPMVMPVPPMLAE